MRYTISLACASLSFASAALAEVPAVATDILPVQSLVAQVMGDLGTPGLIMEKGADAHDFQLRPSQARAVAEADLLVWVGPEMAPWLDRVADGLASGAALDLLHLPGTELRSYGAADHDHEAEAEHDHDHSGTDPHAWLDPANARLWLAAIAGDLSRLDPANAATYAANAEAASAAIAEMDEGLAAKLAPVRAQPFMVMHDAYGYFAAHYGLTIAGSVAAGDAASPGAAHLRDLEARLAGDRIVCIFPEANHDPKLIAQLAEAGGLRVGAPLDPEGAALDPGPGAYAALMEGLADTLVACLGAE